MSIGSAVFVGKMPIHCTLTAPMTCCRKPSTLDATPACSGTRLTEVAVTLGPGLDAPEAVLRAAAAEGVDLRAITAELEREGVAAFCDAYRQLLGCIESKLGSLSAVA